MICVYVTNGFLSLFTSNQRSVWKLHSPALNGSDDRTLSKLKKIVIFKQALHFKQVNLEHFDKLNEYTLFCLSFTRH